jgi:hypothetical protein
MPPGSFGGAWSFIIYGYLEVNTPVTFSGAGNKIFRDGIKGSSSITQAPGSGAIETSSADANLDGSLTFYLTSGLYLEEGIIIPHSANITISGPCYSFGKIEIQTGAHLTLENGTILTITN